MRFKERRRTRPARPAGMKRVEVGRLGTEDSMLPECFKSTHRS